jgi:hypothetical protein
MAERFICPDDHKHEAVGTCYVIHKCRCTPCRTARGAAETRRNRLKAYGRYDNGLVDAGPVREHIHYLQSCGLGWKRIAELSGAGTTAIGSLIYGRKGGNADPRKGEVIKRTTREKAERILAVKPDISVLAPGALMSARGTHRRLQALVCIGWSQTKLATRLGFEMSNFGGVMLRDRVTVKLHLAAAELYEELWNTPPAHESHYDLIAFNRSRNQAKAKGWLPPLTWDDIDNDEQPTADGVVEGMDEIAIDLAMHGEPVKLTTLERREAVTQLHARRLSDQRIAATLHLDYRTVLRIRQELGLVAFAYGELRQADAA